jgi:hypothetical protein
MFALRAANSGTTEERHVPLVPLQLKPCLLYPPKNKFIAFENKLAHIVCIFRKSPTRAFEPIPPLQIFWLPSCSGIRVP